MRDERRSERWLTVAGALLVLAGMLDCRLHQPEWVPPDPRAPRLWTPEPEPGPASAEWDVGDVGRKP